MSFILMAVTRGDDLLGPQQIPIAASEDRSFLEGLQVERAVEREDFYLRNALPRWAMGAAVLHDDIVEVLAV